EIGEEDLPSLMQKMKSDWSLLLRFVELAKNDKYYFYLRELETGQKPRIRINGKEMLMFTSNNYLGLTNDPRVKECAIEAIREFGTGCCGSPVVNGYTTLHENLSRQIAAFKRKEDAIIFSTGYQTNVGTISALVEAGDIVFIDKLNHASIIDGCKLSGAYLRAFNHNDMEKLENLLKESAQYKRKLIVVDGVYSMDGDIANLPEICYLAKKYSAMVMVDEAHATGVMGSNGRGVVEHYSLEDEVDIIMGTMSKSLASIGGFVASSKEVINYLRHYARSFIYSAALPPPAVATASAAIKIIESEFPALGKRLWKNAMQFKNGLNRLGYNTLNTVTPIIPIFLGEDPLITVQMTRRLEEEGLFISPMLPPSVQPNKSRLRAHISAHHSSEEIQQAIDIFERVGKELKVI
ncbi:MAG: pyridoxal phosphate-dependent aminotransferase family protein, partial [Nitrospinae bacterium]|nr:pyridoxal phosphate-dependent aminotransferase family protein [Nitrospinota bacterium]